MPSKLPFRPVYVWASNDFYTELKRQSDKIRQERGFDIPPSYLTHQIANDLKSGNIKLNMEIIKFRNQQRLKIDNNKYVKIKKIKTR